MIETLDDIIEQLADQLGVYGAHYLHSTDGPCKCRCCWTSQLKDRIQNAVEVERRLVGLR